MKIKGKTISGPSNETVIIPRADGDIVFTAQAVLNFDEFEAICPEPLPPTLKYPDGRMSQDFNDKEYIKSVKDFSGKRFDWLVLKSLSATEGLEWTTVDMSNPDTYKNYTKELHQSFTHLEVNRILTCVNEANGLNEAKYQEARDRFTKSQVAESK